LDLIEVIQHFSLNTLDNYNTNDSISVILVEPSKPQNLGNIARVILNFGFSNLILVNPLLDLKEPEIQIAARRANIIINQAEIVYSLKDIRARFDLMIGTTARVGSDYNLKRVAITPDQLLTNENNFDKLAVVFGREQHGLTNKEITLCDLIVTIPTRSSYQVMNISHAAAIILYFLSQKLKNTIQNDSVDRPKHRGATYNERKLLLSYFERLIKLSGYYQEKQHIAAQAFQNVLSRGYITGREATTLMGVFKWINLNLQNKLMRS
jgi:tRNA/rRNA methyltransferase